MAGAALRGAVALTLAALVAGCGGSEPAASDRGKTVTIPQATDTPAPAERTTPPATGPVYELSGSLCEKADHRAIKELYPKREETPLVDTAKLCIIDWLNSNQVFTLTIDAKTSPGEREAKEWFEGTQEVTRYRPTGIPGVGAGAFWQEPMRGEVRLTSYHGNLVLRVEGSTDQKRGFPKDIKERLSRVANGTYQNLAP